MIFLTPFKFLMTCPFFYDGWLWYQDLGNPTMRNITYDDLIDCEGVNMTFNKF